MTSETDQAAVKKVISDFVENWNQHDSKALAALHTADANFVNIFGQWSKGRDNIEATLHRVHDTAFANSKMVMDVDQIKFPAPNVAVVNGTMELLNVPPEVAGRCHYLRVLVKTDEKWLISEFQNTMIRAGDPGRKWWLTVNSEGCTGGCQEGDLSCDLTANSSKPGMKDVRGAEIGHDFIERITFVIGRDHHIIATLSSKEDKISPDQHAAKALAIVQKLAGQ